MIRILEIAWLSIAILTAGIAVWQFFSEGPESAVFMLIGTAAASVMYFIRRRQRIRYDSYRKGDESGKYH